MDDWFRREAETVWVYGELVAETAAAELWDIDDEQFWLPKSQIFARAEGKIEVARWLARREGLG